MKERRNWFGIIFILIVVFILSLVVAGVLSVFFEEDGVEYEYWECQKCGEELLDMNQLHKTAEEYRKLKRSKDIKFMKWGNSIAVRIPKTISDEVGITPGKEGIIVKEKNYIKIMLT